MQHCPLKMLHLVFERTLYIVLMDKKKPRQDRGLVVIFYRRIYFSVKKYGDRHNADSRRLLETR